MAVCRGCGRDIIFIRTPQGRKMPCEKELQLYWVKEGGKERIVSIYGEVFACELEGDPLTASGVGHRPHWATCEAKDMFKAGGRRGRVKIASPEEALRHLQALKALLN